MHFECVWSGLPGFRDSIQGLLEKYSNVKVKNGIFRVIYIFTTRAAAWSSDAVSAAAAA